MKPLLENFPVRRLASFLGILLVVGCVVLIACGCGSGRRVTEEYKTWTAPYGSRPITSRWFGPQEKLKLIITTVESEVDTNALNKIVSAGVTNSESLARFNQARREQLNGWEVCCTGDIHQFWLDSEFSAGGGSCKKLSPQELVRVDQLISALPRDDGRLPRMGSRLVVQVVEHERWKLFVYNRDHPPSAVSELLQMLEKR